MAKTNKELVVEVLAQVYPRGLTPSGISEHLPQLDMKARSNVLWNLKNDGVTILDKDSKEYSLRTAPESYSRRLMDEYRNRPGTMVPGDKGPALAAQGPKPTDKGPEPKKQEGTVVPTPGMGEKTRSVRPVGTMVPTDNSAPADQRKRPAAALSVGDEPGGVLLPAPDAPRGVDRVPPAPEKPAARSECPMPETLRRELDALSLLDEEPPARPEHLQEKLEALAELAAILESSIAGMLRQIAHDLRSLDTQRCAVDDSLPLRERLAAELAELRARRQSVQVARLDLKCEVLARLAERLRPTTGQLLRAIAADLRAAAASRVAGSRAA